MRITRGKIIPRDDGKRIEELVGNATTRTSSVSVARMLAPPGWKEPGQTPKFDEVVVVLRGQLTLVVDGKIERIGAGETGLVPKNHRVIYRNDSRGACEYLSVCAPAFRPDLAKMEPSLEPPSGNVVQISVGHARGEDHRADVEQRAAGFLRALELSNRELSIALVGDRGIRRLNRMWRKKDQPTDVLSFPAAPPPKGTPGPVPLGDIAISLDTAKRRAMEDGRPIDAEIARYLAHGLLHLLGYDHERSPAAAKKMAAVERKLLGFQGLIPAQ